MNQKLLIMKLTIKRAVISISLLLGAAAPMAAESFDCSVQWKAVENKALFAMISGDYATALQLIRPLADCGVAEAQVNVGLMYSAGWGVPENHAEAVKWFQLAADQGHAEGQRWLGEMYYVSQNYADALIWFQRAADQENEYAQAMLGDMYSKGEGVPQDYVRAYMWYVLALASNQVLVVKRIVALEPHMTHVQMAEASKLAREWKRTKQQAR